MTAPQPLTAWQRLRVTATAGLPVTIMPDDLRVIAKVGEHLDQMIDQKAKLLQDRQAMMDTNGDLLRRLVAAEKARADLETSGKRMLDSADELIAFSAKLRGSLLLWRVIALCALAVLIAVVGVVR